MKELFRGVGTLLGSIIVFTTLSVVGFVYSLLYSIWLTVSLKDWKAFFLFWLRILDGVLAAFGFILYQIAIGWDYLANVLAGELTEDFITYKEETKFTDKNTTISASIGELESKGSHSLNKRGKRISKLLNIVFNQKNHALDSWAYKLQHEKLKKSYFKPRKK